MADKALIAAAGELAKSQTPIDAVSSFTKTFMPAYEAAEKEKQAVQNEVAGYMASLKSDIDFTSLTPEMEKEVRRYLTISRNEYNELANNVARIKDHSSEEYQNAVDRMSEIQREFATLAGELTTYNQEKVNTADMFQSNAYSNGYAMSNPKEFALHKDIYGLTEKGMPPISIQNGHLTFGTKDGQIKYSNIKAIPAKSTEVIDNILTMGSNASKAKTKFTQNELNQATYRLTESFKDPNVFASVLFDAPDNSLPLLQIKEEYIKARDNGTLNDIMPQLINDAVNAIVTSYDTTAAQSAQAYQDSLDTTPDGTTGPFANLSDDSLATLRYYKAGKARFDVKGGDKAVIFDKNGNPMVIGGLPNKDFTPPASYYEVGQYDSAEIWKANPNYERIPIGKPAEAVRILGLK